MWRRLHALVALVAWINAACVMPTSAQNPERVSRDEFLRDLDRTLNSRDASKLAVVADRDAWAAASRPPLETFTLWLPPGPLTRKRDLSPTEVLYEDATGNTWRLRLVQDEKRGGWKITILNRPCPPRTMPRRPLGGDPGEAASPAGSSTSEKIWTPLECWPLPK